jgi:POT family proton-dependent oligopeptide transporter
MHMAANHATTLEQPPAPPSLFSRLLTPLKGHPAGFWFIFWGEFAERCSYYGMAAILARYANERLQLDGFLVMSLFKAAAYFLPLVGGWLADRYFGKYWTIVGFSIPYILGHVILGFENVPALMFALALLAMGSGVIKPNISTLMGMTYDQKRPGQDQLRSTAFAYFYLAINIGAFLSQAALPKIRTAYDYWIAFLVPAVLMVIAFAIFAMGKKHYAKETIVKALPPEEHRERWRVLGAVALLFLPVVFFWAVFDQSHSVWVFFARDYLNLQMFGWEVEADQMQAINPLMIMVLLPLMTFMWTALADRGTKVRATDKMMLGFVLTAGVLVVFVIASLLTGPAETRTVNASISSSELRLSIVGDQGTRVWQGQVARDPRKPNDPELFIATLTSGAESADISGTVKQKEGSPGSITLAEAGPALGWLKSYTFPGGKEVKTYFVEPAKKASLWFQVLAYLVLTIAEILISVTGLELAFVVAPNSMKSFITAVWLAVVGVANLAVNAPLAWPYERLSATAFFGLQLGIMAIIIISFYVIARRFNRMQKEREAAATAS